MTNRARSMSPVEMTRRVNRFLAELPGVLKRAGKAVAKRIAGRSVGTYMRDAKGQGRRADGDSGPLRIVSGSLARAMNNSPGSGGIERISTTGAKATLEKGVDLSVVPYARIHEKGGDAGRGLATKIPARPYLDPAVRAELDEAKRLVGRMVTESLRKSLRSSVGGAA